MTNLYKAPVRTTIGRKTAHQLIADAKICHMASGDYLVCHGDYELHVTDDGDLAVSDFGVYIGIMVLSNTDYTLIKGLQSRCEENYEIDALAGGF